MPLSDTFLTKGRDMGARLGLSFTQLLFVMNSESSLNPGALNANGGAAGLSQIMPQYLPGLGWNDGPEEFAKLSAEGQLPYIERYFRPWANKKLDSIGRIYQANFAPATLDDPNPGPDQPVYRRDGDRWGGAETGYYSSNAKYFDKEGKGFISVGDLEAAVMRAAKERGDRLNAALTRMKELYPGDYKMAAGLWLAWSVLVAVPAAMVYFLTRKKR